MSHKTLIRLKPPDDVQAYACTLGWYTLAFTSHTLTVLRGMTGSGELVCPVFMQSSAVQPSKPLPRLNHPHVVVGLTRCNLKSGRQATIRSSLASPPEMMRGPISQSLMQQSEDLPQLPQHKATNIRSNMEDLLLAAEFGGQLTGVGDLVASTSAQS
ncbi:unnamed protein product [Clonostachys rhizophaga]|uniref:Uncharacterized protein n=1 Tax=Clonostachys rhizophaga TaxID=160324 RepID=A0A9N9VRI4_9HYPO|nr:unnamed protein product [Clonostachys rhizophaga]